MTTNESQCLRSHSKRDYIIRGVILSGNIERITAPWGEKLQANVNCWEIVKIARKNCGIVATTNIPKGTIIAMYGGVIFDQKKEKQAVTVYSMDMKDSGETLAINAYKWNILPKFARAALANELDAACHPNQHFYWMNPYVIVQSECM